MTTFNIGPSKISEETKADIATAVRDGVLEISHRSEEFSEISENAIEGLRKFLGIPEDYEILYTTSATNAMQIALANCCRNNSFHFVCGNFSKLFAKVSGSLGKNVSVDEVGPGQVNDYANCEIPNEVDFVSITHNETSTGVQVPADFAQHIKKQNPEAILAVDVTSSAGATAMNIADADTWLFSVQKCFGLPAGLGVLIVSQKAIEKSKQICQNKENRVGYLTLEKMLGKMEGAYQTLYTPNVLDIYLLSKTVARWNEQGGLEKNIEATMAKKELFEKFIESCNGIDFFAEDEESCSDSVFCLEAEEQLIAEIHRKAEDQNLVIGKGYGDLKTKTFRIANFPNISQKEIENLIGVLKAII